MDICTQDLNKDTQPASRASPRCGVQIHLSPSGALTSNWVDLGYDRFPDGDSPRTRVCVFDLVDFIERGFQESHSLSQVQSGPVLQLLCAGPQHVALHLDPLRLGGDEGIVNAGIHRGGAGLAALYFTIFRAARSFSTSENARIFFTASGTASISFISTASSNRPRATMAIACRSLALFRDNRVSMWAYGQRTRSV